MVEIINVYAAAVSPALIVAAVSALFVVVAVFAAVVTAVVASICLLISNFSMRQKRSVLQIHIFASFCIGQIFAEEFFHVFVSFSLFPGLHLTRTHY